MRKCDERAYHAEMKKWIDEGYLELHDWEKHGPVKAIIPLMAVSQPNKSTKVRPVMDYRAVNKHMLSLPGCDVAVCDEKVRNWRKMGSNVKLLDLCKAYLQIHVAP